MTMIPPGRFDPRFRLYRYRLSDMVWYANHCFHREKLLRSFCGNPRSYRWVHAWEPYVLCYLLRLGHPDGNPCMHLRTAVDIATTSKEKYFLTLLSLANGAAGGGWDCRSVCRIARNEMLAEMHALERGELSQIATLDFLYPLSMVESVTGFGDLMLQFARLGLEERFPPHRLDWLWLVFAHSMINFFDCTPDPRRRYLELKAYLPTVMLYISAMSEHDPEGGAPALSRMLRGLRAA